MAGLALGLIGYALFAGADPSSSAFAGLERAHRVPRIESFWLGLERGTSRAPAMGIVVLRPPLERRVRITGGRFVMGSTPSEMVLAIKLCEREALGAEHAPAATQRA